VVVPEQVVDVDSLGGEVLVVFQVADRELELLVVFTVDDERLSRDCSFSSTAARALVLISASSMFSSTMSRPSFTKSDRALFRAPIRIWRGGR